MVQYWFNLGLTLKTFNFSLLQFNEWVGFQKHEFNTYSLVLKISDFANHNFLITRILGWPKGAPLSSD